MLIGCSHSAKPKAVAKPEEPKVEPQTINVGQAEATRYRDDPRERLWTIKWVSGQIDVRSEKSFGGHLEQVSGTLFHKDEPVSTYTADGAEADKDTDLLRLYGHVTIKSLADDKAVLTCDEVEWLANTPILKAKGAVKLVAAGKYEAGTFKELWVTTTMDSFGTPDQFKQ